MESDVTLHPHIRVGGMPARIVVVAATILLGAAPAVAAQGHQLQLSPSPGDTLRMVLDQQTEVTSEARPGMPARTMKARFQVFSHAIVGARLADATMLVARTDSVSLDSDDEHASRMAAQAQAMAGGAPVMLRLASDGTIRLVNADGTVADLAEAVSLIPAALPQGRLAIGDTWIRSMPVPVGPTADAGTVRATFRLDSIGRGGRIAYISVRGDMARKDVPAAGPRGTVMSIVGTVAGSLLLDRLRGWIADSRFIVTMHSALQPPASSGIEPMRFKTIVTQRVRLQDRQPARRTRP
jgi:hypothetical protein